jgi:hypothetical protein
MVGKNYYVGCLSWWIRELFVWESREEFFVEQRLSWVGVEKICKGEGLELDVEGDQCTLEFVFVISLQRLQSTPFRRDERLCCGSESDCCDIWG